MVFGSSSHICHFKDGGFIVDQKYRIKDRTNSYWPGQPMSRGWITPKPVHPRLWYADSSINEVLSRRDLTAAEAQEAERTLGDIEAQPPLPEGPLPEQACRPRGPPGDLLPLPLIIMFDWRPSV